MTASSDSGGRTHLPTVPDLETVNGLDADAARDVLLACCASPRWAAAVVVGRP